MRVRYQCPRLQPRSRDLVYNLTRCTIQEILVPSPDLVHLTGRIISRALSSAHVESVMQPSDQGKVIAERRRTSCMTRKIVTPARDQWRRRPDQTTLKRANPNTSEGRSFERSVDLVNRE